MTADRPELAAADSDTLYSCAVAAVVRQRSVSTSWLQRRLCISYNRAALILAQMELAGIVGRIDNQHRRDVIAWLH